MTAAWRKEERDELVAGWNRGLTIEALIAAFPRHASRSAIYREVNRLRGRGIDLPKREGAGGRPPLSREQQMERAEERAAAARRARAAAQFARAAAQFAREEEERRRAPPPPPPPLPIVRQALFTDDARARADRGSGGRFSAEPAYSLTGCSLR